MLADWPYDQYQVIGWIYWKGDPSGQVQPTPEHPREFPFDNENTLWTLEVVESEDNLTVVDNLFGTPLSVEHAIADTYVCYSQPKFNTVLGGWLVEGRRIQYCHSGIRPRLQISIYWTNDVSMVTKCDIGRRQNHISIAHHDSTTRI